MIFGFVCGGLLLALSTSGCRLLLGHTVECAESPDETDGVYAHNFTVRITVLQLLHGDVIGRVGKCGNDDRIVGNVLVTVARRQPILFLKLGLRHKQRNRN